ncbi:MAG TPA: response regulator [Polyangiaceae bacterium]|nr:response regulator [Polyangiaceae bacterium]
MSKGRIVVIEGDDWIARLVEEGLNEAGYEVMLSSEALEGFEQVRASQPDCIICDVALPDFDGYWVAHKVRTDPSPMSTTPFLFLTNADDDTSPLHAFHVGADVQVQKPFRLDEVVAQVRALVEMAKRLRMARDSFLDKEGEKPPQGEALRGDLAQISVTTVLALLEMERRTGQLRVTQEGPEPSGEATIDLAGGFAVGSALSGAATPLLPTLREILKWKKGTIAFFAWPDAPARGPKKPIAAMLMEAAQLNASGTLLPGKRRTSLASNAAAPNSVAPISAAPTSVGPSGRPSTLPEARLSMQPKSPSMNPPARPSTQPKSPAISRAAPTNTHPSPAKPTKAPAPARPSFAPKAPPAPKKQ